MIFEFSYEENMIIPSELFATLKLRENKLLELPKLEHPLIMNYKNLFPAEDVACSELYLKVIEKVKTDYLNPHYLSHGLVP
jgi:hypothetical protein